MNTLTAARCPDKGIGDWRVANGLPRGQSSPPDRLSAPTPDSPYWLAHNLETSEVLKVVAGELAKLGLYRLSWILSQEASIALDRNSAFLPSKRIEYPHESKP